MKVIKTTEMNLSQLDIYLLAIDEWGSCWVGHGLGVVAGWRVGVGHG